VKTPAISKKAISGSEVKKLSNGKGFGLTESSSQAWASSQDLKRLLPKLVSLPENMAHSHSPSNLRAKFQLEIRRKCLGRVGI
jgi:hypothetical protein